MHGTTLAVPSSAMYQSLLYGTIFVQIDNRPARARILSNVTFIELSARSLSEVDFSLRKVPIFYFPTSIRNSTIRVQYMHSEVPFRYNLAVDCKTVGKLHHIWRLELSKMCSHCVRERIFSGSLCAAKVPAVPSVHRAVCVRDQAVSIEIFVCAKSCSRISCLVAGLSSWMRFRVLVSKRKIE